MSEQAATADGGLPPLAPPGATDQRRAQAVVARFVARFGALPLEHCRQVYASQGVEWPGDEDVRQQFPVSDASEPAIER